MLGKTGDTLALPSMLGPQPTPVSPNFPQPIVTQSIPTDTLAKWQETAATIHANQMNGETAALTSLGDYLISNKWVEAAHAW